MFDQQKQKNTPLDKDCATKRKETNLEKNSNSLGLVRHQKRNVGSGEVERLSSDRRDQQRIPGGKHFMERKRATESRRDLTIHSSRRVARGRSFSK